MAKSNGGDMTLKVDALVTTFHQVHSLIPDNQEILTIKPDTRVVDALKLMQKYRYSQLPVVVGKAVLGVFSYRSFSERALTKQKSIKGEWLGELPVEDFLEEYEFVHGSQDWNRVAGYLNQDDAFFVGNRDRMEGLVTTVDVLDYFREIATPFIILAEIEQSLRKTIQACIAEDELPLALERSLSSAYTKDDRVKEGAEGKEGGIPQSLDELTFDNYAQIISNNDNWLYFVPMFGDSPRARKQTNDKLRQLRNWRNDVFHLKRRLESWEVDTLGEHRSWLQRRMRAFEAKRIQETSPEQSVKSKRGKMTRERLLSESDPAAAEFFEWLLSEARNMARHFAIEWHPVSFSIRLRRDGRLLGFIYGYAPDRLEIYFNYLDLEPDVLSRLRDLILDSGVFEEAGKHSLKAQATQINDEQLREACRRLIIELLRIEEIRSYNVKSSKNDSGNSLREL